eukprot:scaffold61018_cov52-Cyclotella_meneghiniana.AAC.4
MALSHHFFNSNNQQRQHLPPLPFTMNRLQVFEDLSSGKSPSSTPAPTDTTPDHTIVTTALVNASKRYLDGDDFMSPGLKKRLIDVMALEAPPTSVAASTSTATAASAAAPEVFAPAGVTSAVAPEVFAPAGDASAAAPDRRNWHKIPFHDQEDMIFYCITLLEHIRDGDSHIKELSFRYGREFGHIATALREGDQAMSVPSKTGGVQLPTLVRIPGSMLLFPQALAGQIEKIHSSEKKLDRYQETRNAKQRQQRFQTRIDEMIEYYGSSVVPKYVPEGLSSHQLPYLSRILSFLAEAPHCISNLANFSIPQRQQTFHS